MPSASHNDWRLVIHKVLETSVEKEFSIAIIEIRPDIVVNSQDNLLFDYIFPTVHFHFTFVTAKEENDLLSSYHSEVAYNTP